MSVDLTLADFTAGAVVAGVVAGVVMLIGKKFAANIANFLRRKLNSVNQSLNVTYTGEFETLLKVKIIEVFRQKLNLYLITFGILLGLASSSIIASLHRIGVSESAAALILAFIYGAGFGLLIALAEAHQLILRKLLLEYETEKLNSKKKIYEAELAQNAH